MGFAYGRLMGEEIDGNMYGMFDYIR